MAEIATAPKPAAAPKILRAEQPPTAKPGSFQSSEFARARFDHVMQAGVPFEACLTPGYWSNVFHILQRNVATNAPDRSGAFVDVGTQDHAFIAKLYVRAVTSGGLIVQCIGPGIEPKTGRACPIDLSTGLPWTGGAPLNSDQFEVKWNVGKRGFDIIRKSDLQIVADGGQFPTRELAAEWIAKTSKAAA